MVVAGGGMGGVGGTVVNAEGAACAGAFCGTEAACCDAAGAVKSTQWRFVGAGGNYNQTTSYQYAGEGGGAYIQEGVITFYGWKVKRVCLGLPLLLALVLVIIFWWPDNPPVTTTSVFSSTTSRPTTRGPSPEGSCKLWGDPHVLTFDGFRPSFYGTGEFFIVKSDKFMMQGRFMATPYTKGLSATNKIAVGGPVAGNKVIEVGSLDDGPVTVDGQPVLTSLGMTYSTGAVQLAWNQVGDLPDAAASVFPRNIVHLTLQAGIRVEVFRFKNYIDVRVAMPSQPLGQDGVCGNFNGNAADDSTAAIFLRGAGRVPPGQSLFTTAAAPSVSQAMQTMIATSCGTARLAYAKQSCAKVLGVAGTTDRATLDSCVYDMCFGDNAH